MNRSTRNSDIPPREDSRGQESTIRALGNTAAEQERMVSYLESVDDLFPIRLSTRVDLGRYARKLLEYGIVRAAVDERGRIVGLVAFYANDAQSQTAYLSLVVVSREAQGRGVGHGLMADALAIAARRGMRRMRLEVQRRNAKAQDLYAQLGFRAVDSEAPADGPVESMYWERPLP